MLQESEIFCLVLGLIGLPLLKELRARFRLPQADLFMAGYLCTVAAYAFTVAEGFFWPQLCNLLEHFCYALAALAFAAACLRLSRPESSAAARPPDESP